MLVAVPALFLLFAWLAAASRIGLRQGFVVATVAYTAGVVAATEALSLPGWLGLPGVLAFWSAATVGAFWCWRRGDAEARREGLRAGLRDVGSAWTARGAELCGIAIVLGMVLLTGLLSPPNNWESMAYRMMRVAMWMQQGSVDHFPTPYMPQLYHPPLASFHVLHLQILAGGDRFANVPEWLALAGCGVAASLIAKELKGELPVQVVAAVLAVTLPMGITQGSSTQGNLLAAYWLLCFVLLLVWHLRTPALWRLLCCGLAAGFAVLAKPTAYVVLPPVAVALGLYGVAVCRRPGRAILALAAVAAIAVVVNSGLYARNWQAFGDPVSPPAEFDQLNERLDATVLVANLLRNSLVHWGLPSPSANAAILGGVAAVVGGLPEPAAATAGGGTLAEAGLPYRFTEMQASNVLHHWLLAITLVGFCVRRWRPESTRLAAYLLGAWGAAVVTFSAVLQWQEWNSRYHVMLFMLGAPLAAVFLNHALRRRRDPGAGTTPAGVGWSLRAASGVFLLATVPWLLFKESSPWIRLDFGYEVMRAEPLLGADRSSAYFNAMGGGHDGFRALADQVAELGAADVGLAIAPDLQGVEYGYPLRVLLRDRVETLVYYDIGRDNPTRSLARGMAPLVVVKTGDDWWAGDRRWLYRRVWTHPGRAVSVWRRAEAPFRPLMGRELRQGWSRDIEAAVCEAALGAERAAATVVDDLLIYVVTRRRTATGTWLPAATHQPALPMVGELVTASLSPLGRARNLGLRPATPWLWERRGGGAWQVVDDDWPPRRYAPTTADCGLRLRATTMVLCGGRAWQATTPLSAPVAGCPGRAGPRAVRDGWKEDPRPEIRMAAVFLQAELDNGGGHATHYSLAIPSDTLTNMPNLGVLAVALARERLRALRMGYVTDGGRVIWEREVHLPDAEA